MSPTAARRPRRPSAPAAAAPVEPDLRDPALYFDRDLGWLAFNERFLAQARDSHPLLERVKFFGIAANNLDEFFMVRLDKADFRARDQATVMLQDLSQFWNETLRPLLADERIHIIDATQYTDDD